MTTLDKPSKKPPRNGSGSKTKRAQADVVARLNRTDLPRARYRGLAECATGQCGMQRCRDVCCYGRKRRLAKDARAIRRLLKKNGGPYYEVRVGRGTWSQTGGQLDKLSLAAARQLNRRAFDALNKPSIVAVGRFKVGFEPHPNGGRWRGEVHQVVAGASRDEIQKAFTTRLDAGRDNYLWIDKVATLRGAVGRVLLRDGMIWQSANNDDEPKRPPKRVRGEYYRWALSFGIGARTVRYGCDQHFNKLRKRGTTIRPKTPKPRPKPVWLAPYQFGTDTRERMDQQRRSTSGS
jgi:hypothetical protein